MAETMQTSTVIAIGAEAIREWIAHHLAPACPAGAEISVINRPWHCKGESAFFADVAVESSITINQLRGLEVIEHRRGQHLHFYVDDVIAAAVGCGSLAGIFFHVHYHW